MQAGQQDACFDGVEGTNTTDCNDGQGSFKFLSEILIKYSDWDKLTESTCKANFVTLNAIEISSVQAKLWQSGEVALWFILRSLTVLSKKGKGQGHQGSRNISFVIGLSIQIREWTILWSWNLYCNMQRESMSPEPNFVRSLELCTNQFVRRLYKWDKLWFSFKSYWLTDQFVHLHGHALSFSFCSHFYLNKSACFVGIYYKMWVI